MNYAILSAIFIGFLVETSLADSVKENFIQLCGEEGKLLKEFDSLEYDDYQKIQSSQLLLKVRGDRKKVGEILKYKDCSRLSGIDRPPLDDLQMFHRQCAHEKQLELEAAGCRDEMAKKELERLFKESRQARRRLAKEAGALISECPTSIIADTTKQGQLSSALMEHFELICSEEAFYESMEERLARVKAQLDYSSFHNLWDRTHKKFLELTTARRGFCDNSVAAVCCPNQLVEDYRAMGGLKAVEELLVILERSVSPSDRSTSNNHSVGDNPVTRRNNALHKLEQIYKMDAEREKDAAKRAQLEEAHQLIKAECEKLDEASSGSRSSKFKLFKW